MPLLPTPWCELPAWYDLDAWLKPLSTNDKWMAKFPLVEVSFEPTFKINDAYLCSYGFSFLAEAITSFLLLVIAVGCVVRLQVSYPHSHHPRKILFVLLAIVGLVRGIYNAMASQKVMALDMYIDTLDIIPWFLKTNVPVNAICDLLVAYIDFMLTFFWLDIMYHRFVRSRLGVGLQAVLFLTSSVALAITLGLDYDDVVNKHEFNDGNIFYRSVSYLVGLFFISGLMHIAVVVLLVYTMFRVTGDITVFMDRKMRLNILIVAVIGFVSAVCLLIRAAVLLGRVTWTQRYVTGIISLDNPTFTTVYYVVMMNLPCIVVAVAFAVLTHKLITEESREREDNVGTRDSLIASSPVLTTASGTYGGERSSTVRVGPRSPLVVGGTSYRKQLSMKNIPASRQVPGSSSQVSLNQQQPSESGSTPDFSRNER